MASAVESVVETPFRLASSVEQSFFIVQGHVIPGLKLIPSNFVDCIVTSPPYWGLRDYGEETVTIWDAEEGCEHEWGTLERGHHVGQVPQTKNQVASGSEDSGTFCQKCGAWRGQLGLEPSLDLYLSHLLQITSELKRVLKPSGVMFWNHGDSYGGSGNASGHTEETTNCGKKTSEYGATRGHTVGAYQAKCMCLQNYRLIERMIDEQGWILRNIIPWVKPNHMPSSVKDRFTNGYEPIFMLTKNNKPLYYWNERTGLMADNPPSERIEGRDWEWREVGSDYSECDTKITENEAEMFCSPRARKHRDRKIKKYSFWHSLDYWFDLDAVREPFTAPLNRWGGNNVKIPENTKWDDAREKERWQMSIRDRESRPNPSGKNPGDVWTIPTQPFPDAHFAVFPEEIPERAIKCSCPKEICTQCGKARVRITDREEIKPRIIGGIESGIRYSSPDNGVETGTRMGDVIHQTIGWTTCSCNAEFRPGIVLDPFLGSGTTMKKARERGMSCIGIDISPKYIEMAKKEVGWNEGLFGIEFHEIKA